MKYYRYTLIHSVEGSLVLTHAPQEWASDRSFWERSMTYWGVFRSFSTKELSFIKAGATWLKNIFDTYGTEADVSYQVEALNVTTYDYDIIYTGILDFTTYQYVTGNSGTFVKLQVIDDAFLNTVKTREALDINLASLYDLDGNAITPFTDEGVAINVPSRIDNYSADYTKAVLNQQLESHVPMITYTSRDEGSAVEPSDTNAIATVGGAFFTPTFSSTLVVNIQMSGTIHLIGYESIYCLIRHYDSAGTLKAGTTLFSKIGSSYVEDYTINVDDDHTFYSVGDGDYVILLFSVTGEDPDTKISYVISMDIGYNRTILSDFSLISYPYHEAFTRILQSITGSSNPFYSLLLGRTDSDITSYVSDGSLSLGVVTNGLLVRGFELTDTDVSLSLSLRSLFNSLSAIHPLCLGVETISSTKKIRIEEITHAFDEHYFLTIENCSEITEEVAVDLTYTSLSLGFAKHDETWNEVKGRYEYNATSNYSTSLKRAQNEFSRVSPYRADGNAIIYARQSSVNTEAAGENTPYDNDVILLSVCRDSGDFKIKEDDGYSLVGNVDNPEQSYNLDYSPGRALRRWGSFLRGCLEKYTSTIISFLSSDKNSSMYSQLTSESSPVYEGANVDVSDLNDPFFENIYYTFDCVILNQMVSLLNGNTDGKPNTYFIIRFRGNESEDYKYGWIMKVDALKENNKGRGQIKLLKVNTTYVTPSAASTSYTADSTTITVDSTLITSDSGTI